MYIMYTYIQVHLCACVCVKARTSGVIPRNAVHLLWAGFSLACSSSIRLHGLAIESCLYLPTTGNTWVGHCTWCFMWVPGLDWRSSCSWDTNFPHWTLSSSRKRLFWGPVIFRLLEVVETRKKNDFTDHVGKREYPDLSSTPRAVFMNIIPMKVDIHIHHTNISCPALGRLPSSPSCSLKQNLLAATCSGHEIQSEGSHIAHTCSTLKPKAKSNKRI